MFPSKYLYTMISAFMINRDIADSLSDEKKK